MVQRIDDSRQIDGAIPPEADDTDDRLGEAIEEYLALAEQDQAPDLEEFIARYPDLKDDLRAAMEGLELVHGLVGRGVSPSSGSSRGSGWDRRLESGHRIAGYRVVRELGRGGMGTVYEAVHVGLDRPVALKVLGTHAAPDSSARRRFLNEAKTAAGLHHTHIVPVFDVGQVGGLCYYAMQRIEGSGLDQVIRHLRRTRPAGGSGSGWSRPALPSSPGESLAAPEHSSISSRFGRLWFRVSTGWLWRSTQQLPDAPGGVGMGWDRDGCTPVLSGPVGPGGTRRIPHESRERFDGFVGQPPRRSRISCIEAAERGAIRHDGGRGPRLRAGPARIAPPRRRAAAFRSAARLGLFPLGGRGRTPGRRCAGATPINKE